MNNLNQPSYFRNISVCRETGGDVEEIETVEKDDEKEIMSDTFPVWKKIRHTRNQHPGFC